MTISVIVPAYRRPVDLARCLAALGKQTRPADQVLVTVRDTDAETRGFLAAREGDALPLRVVEVTVPGVVAAMNAALALATGEIIALTDDDGAPWPDWLERIHGHFQSDPKLGAVGGRDWQYYDGKLHLNGPPVAHCGRLQWFGRVTAGHHLALAGPAYETDAVKGVNSAYLARALRPIGFDTRLAGTGAQVHWELSLGLTLRRARWKILFDPSLCVDHFPAARFDEDQRRQFNSVAQQNAVANETLALMEHLHGLRRLAFVLWAALIGTRAAPGLAQLPRLAPSGGKHLAALALATWRGRLQGMATYRHSRQSLQSRSPLLSPPGKTS